MREQNGPRKRESQRAIRSTVVGGISGKKGIQGTRLQETTERELYQRKKKRELLPILELQVQGTLPQRDERDDGKRLGRKTGRRDGGLKVRRKNRDERMSAGVRSVILGWTTDIASYHS